MLTISLQCPIFCEQWIEIVGGSGAVCLALFVTKRQISLLALLGGFYDVKDASTVGTTMWYKLQCQAMDGGEPSSCPSRTLILPSFSPRLPPHLPPPPSLRAVSRVYVGVPTSYASARTHIHTYIYTLVYIYVFGV